MLKFMFWNINRKGLSDLICEIVKRDRIDFIILAECKIGNYDLISSLNACCVDKYHNVPGVTKKLKMYSKIPPNFIKPMKDKGGISLRHITTPVGRDLLLVAAHLPSKRFQKEADQTFLGVELVDVINAAESKIGHHRTMVIGDLNMNPFEDGIVGARGLHAVMDKRIAARLSRKVQGDDYRFFYNPMWNYFGDSLPGPPGTYYYDSGKHINMYWNTFDQVLIRPDLMQFFSDEDLRIITKVNSIDLLDNSGKPNSKIGSDHLPILVTLKI